jgi:hypothetical protein
MYILEVKVPLLPQHTGAVFSSRTFAVVGYRPLFCVCGVWGLPSPKSEQ